jgi:type II secretory ATPase GspE/PulE/Tfp pilus assembly ATPase PilB-like protein/DNA-binding NarL/FixJ family response regulator
VSRYAGLFSSGGAAARTQPEVLAPAAAAAAPRYRLLFVDDEPGVLGALKRVFRQQDYEIHTAGGADAALELLAGQSFHLVMTDFRMPGMDGAALLREVRKRQPQALRLMLTAHGETEAVMGAIQEGAVYRFTLKPWNDDDLRLTVALALERYELLERNRTLEAESRERGRDLELLGRLMGSSRSQLGIALHKKGLLNTRQLQQLHADAEKRHQPLVRLLEESRWIDERQVHALLTRELLFTPIDLAELQPPVAALALVPAALCQRNWVLPVALQGKRLTLAMADPMDRGLIDELQFSTGCQIEPVVDRMPALVAALERCFGVPPEGFADLVTTIDSGDPFEGIEIVIDDAEGEESVEALLAGSSEPPAMRLVNALILEGLRLGASDIHIQPRSKQVTIRYRVDGVLVDKIHAPLSLLPAVVSRIKVMAELDIAERRRPQDGRITVRTSLRTADLRISTLPTLNGEKIVMRVLDRDGAPKTLDSLHLSDLNRRRLLNSITRPQGLILATGPTGSGKTTTLYALLQHNATPQKNYITVEDPVEAFVDMAGQVSVRERLGLSFAKVLRAMLRQDPDVILLGEIRDGETAEVALHAAMTGHLVLSTLHTNSAAATVARLIDLGAKPFLLASALEAIVAQRLVRRLCEHCREPAPPAAEQLDLLGPDFVVDSRHTYRAVGCARCHQGYAGRVGLHEVLTVDDDLRDAIFDGASGKRLLGIARGKGMATLLEDGSAKVQQGLTSVDELLRVLGSQVSA